MRQKRTIYFNDARHYYLFIFEPPMRMEDAWRPIDEVVGTAVDTFVYGASRDDGLFYPSKCGMRFCEDARPFDVVPYWRAWHNMQSLIDQGLDPLTVLIDRAHEKDMEFIASLRLGGYGGMPDEWSVAKGGRGFVHEQVRDHQSAVLTELLNDYATEGVELDFAAPPAGGSLCLRFEDAAEYTPVMTEFVRGIAGVAHRRQPKRGVVGARVYPTEELNRKCGLEVRAWLAEGLVDYVVPVLYGDFVVDANMPIEWLVDAAHTNEVSVYATLQPYYSDNGKCRSDGIVYASPAMTRAAAASFWQLDVDGLYTWFMNWPLGDAERRTLCDLGDPDVIQMQDKHYVVRSRTEDEERHDYPSTLPIRIDASDAAKRAQIPFRVADDCGDDRIQSIMLKLAIAGTVSVDRYDLRLNGESLAAEPCIRNHLGRSLYDGQWLEIRLEKVRPKRGRNVLEVGLLERPEDFIVPVTIQDVEIITQYGTLPVAVAPD